MKKIILGSIAVVAIAAIAAFNVSFNSQSDKLSGISLANVEALAQDESGGGSTWQEGTKTIVSTTSPGWTWSGTLNLWLLNGTVTYTSPPNVTTVSIKCCRLQGPLASCSYEVC